ncbi:hypothetical protein SG34_032690 [Thalassomonas viridans]|uniref:Uncharacterized protein n=1 Tax=Thalassomonas viridans TaxID=137584 RepID=A0AAE9ZDV2_9GAMM|nr:hypothetical protein [Thalassomonas viridans]WDE08672.1 hypothetical protein SG34_032690 [Thalassomonas viridans]
MNPTNPIIDRIGESDCATVQDGTTSVQASLIQERQHSTEEPGYVFVETVDGKHSDREATLRQQCRHAKEDLQALKDGAHEVLRQMANCENTPVAMKTAANFAVKRGLDFGGATAATALTMYAVGAPITSLGAVVAQAVGYSTLGAIINAAGIQPLLAWIGAIARPLTPAQRHGLELARFCTRQGMAAGCADTLIRGTEEFRTHVTNVMNDSSLTPAERDGTIKHLVKIFEASVLSATRIERVKEPKDLETRAKAERIKLLPVAQGSVLAGENDDVSQEWDIVEARVVRDAYTQETSQELYMDVDKFCAETVLEVMKEACEDGDGIISGAFKELVESVAQSLSGIETQGLVGGNPWVGAATKGLDEVLGQLKGAGYRERLNAEASARMEEMKETIRKDT